jgi:DNA mismatch repair protein MutS
MTGGDDALRGHSSFAVEMIELNLILSRSTSRSLVLGDEICHGTEHVSGISLVAASIVSLCAKRVPFVFASHLHQLSKMPEIQQLPGLSMKHLTVRRDVETKTLVYVRKLADGSGDATYGIEVAKHIVDDRDFIKMAERFQRSILERQAHVVPDRVSRYNTNMFMGKCQICSKKAIETHHVIQQKDADEHKRVVFEEAKTPASVHHMANLVALCIDCHLSIHKRKGKRLKIEGYEDTAEGRKLKYSWLLS